MQVPETQSDDPQQPALRVQAPPVVLQHAVPPRPLSAQLRPPVQQFGAAPPVVHVAPSARLHVAVALRQVPEVHVRPVQQAEVALQVAPTAAQVGAARQVPLWQVLPVQQSASAWQVVPRA